jgi:hypothetical protein
MVEKVVREAVQHGHGDRGGGQGGGDVDLTAEEEEQRRRLRSMVVVAEPSPYTGAVVMAGRMGSRRCGPNGGGNGRVDGEVVAWTQQRWWWSGGREGGDVDPMAVEAVGEVMAVGEVAVLTRQCLRRRGKIWQPDSVHVKILRFRV